MTDADADKQTYNSKKTKKQKTKTANTGSTKRKTTSTDKAAHSERQKTKRNKGNKGNKGSPFTHTDLSNVYSPHSTPTQQGASRPAADKTAHNPSLSHLVLRVWFLGSSRQVVSVGYDSLSLVSIE
jgi:hypothetical protein